MANTDQLFLIVIHGIIADGTIDNRFISQASQLKTYYNPSYWPVTKWWWSSKTCQVADELQKEECLDVSGERRVFFMAFDRVHVLMSK